MRRGAWMAAVLAAQALGVAGVARGDACDYPPQAISGRSLYPPDGSMGVPLNAAVAVRYQKYLSNEPTEPIGADVVLRPLGGDPTPVVREVRGGTSVTATAVVMKPLQLLRPNTVYEVLDRRVLPCVPFPTTDAPTVTCGAGPLAVFARFTTGTAIDTSVPQFAGAADLSVRPFLQCHFNAVNRPFDVSWAAGSDDVAGTALLYNLYQEGEAVALASYLDGTSAALAMGCNWGLVSPQFIKATYTRGWSPMHESGSFYVRAVDWAGNEDGNKVLRTITDPCTGAPWADGGTTPATTDAGEGGPTHVADASDTPVPTLDAGADVLQNSGVDAPVDAAPVDAASVDAAPMGGAAPVDAAPRDVRTADPPGRDEGGGCAVSPAGGDTAGAGTLALLALWLAIGRRRRRF